jgi:excisionase family DNA binding protein
MTEQLLYRVEDAAKVLSLGRSKTFEEMAAGRLKSVQIGRARRITRAALEEYVEWCAANATPAAS